jgi:hypothetical protein
MGWTRISWRPLERRQHRSVLDLDSDRVDVELRSMTKLLTILNCGLSVLMRLRRRS